MSWYTVATKVLMLLALALPIGWYYGRPLEALLVALVGLLSFWVVQLMRVQAWLEDPSQPPPDVQGIFGDILARIYRHRRTERETQKQLQSTADFFQRSFSSMRDGVVIIDDSGNIEWANRAAENLTGLRFPLDRGQALFNLIRQPEFHDYLELSDYSKPLTYCANTELGLHLMLEVTRFGEGDRLLFFRDVTALLQTDQMRRDFVGNISHELRTPLTVITGYLGAFLDDPDNLPQQYRKPLQQMVQQAERMENLLKDLLWLSRIESEERQEKSGTVNIRGLLEELQEEFGSIYPERPLLLEVQTGQCVAGDYRELYSAVSNLVVNAMRYSPADTSVEVCWRVDAQGVPRLSVRDSGPGIEESHIPRLTERFYRVDDSRSAASGGTGLGLAIVKHVAVSHAAELIIESRVGEGSVFTLAFPAAAGNSLHELINESAPGLLNEEDTSQC